MKKQLGILGFTEINELIDDGVIEFAQRSAVNPASLNVTLGPKFLGEKRNNESVTGSYFGSLSFQHRQSPAFNEFSGSIVMGAGEFCLASIVERLNLPQDIACHVLLRSSAARIGLEHSLAGWGDPGYRGHLTLELKNVLKYHNIRLVSGDQPCQLIFHRINPVPVDKTYGAVSGKYSGDVNPEPIKPEGDPRV